MLNQNIYLCQVFLQPIAYMVEMKEQLEITDLKGNKIGIMNVSKKNYRINYYLPTICQLEVAPCNKKGREYTEADDKFVDSPDELVGKDVHFVFKIVNCRGLPNKYTVFLIILKIFGKKIFNSGCSLQVPGLPGREGHPH